MTARLHRIALAALTEQLALGDDPLRPAPGGAAVLMADRAEEVGLRVPALTAETQARMREVIPGFGVAGNPVDVWGHAGQAIRTADGRLLAALDERTTTVVKGFFLADRIALSSRFTLEAGFKGVSVLIGLMLTLGSSGLVNQIMSGLMITYSRALRVGDFRLCEATKLLAFERHATSKIRDAEDLLNVATLGFRGEALPAIGSVSRLTIETATADGSGTRVLAAGGALLDIGDAARRRGTTVTVESLFYNTPARLKFLRGARSEWRAISEMLGVMALSRRDVRLTVTHDDKEVLTLPPASSLRERIAALWGSAAAEALVDVDDVSGPIRVSGLVQRPADEQ